MKVKVRTLHLVGITMEHDPKCHFNREKFCLLLYVQLISSITVYGDLRNNLLFNKIKKTMDQRIATVLHRIRAVISSACRNYEVDTSGNTNSRSELNASLQNLSRIRDNISDETYSTLSDAINGLLSLNNTNVDYNMGDMGYSAERIRTERGRPIVCITRDQLLLLINENYTVKQMSKKLRCSMSTVRKRLKEEDIKIRNKYSNLEDNELEEIINQIHVQHPNCGSELMWGYLKSRGITVQRCRVRSILNRLDPIGTAARWSNSITRRTYAVPTPNALWHMDAHLKLARWGFIIHGCIDGYSRLIIYLTCNISMQAEPVLQFFMNAVANQGFPSRIRSDHGYENQFVAIVMNLIRGLGRGSHITGQSVHNQRIERLWVDVLKEVGHKVRRELFLLEDDGLLMVDNNRHRFLIQLIYLEYINDLLKSFMNGWNYHKVRSAGRRTPRQIWLDGMLDNFNATRTAITEVFEQQNNIILRTQEALRRVHVNVDHLEANPPIEPSLFQASNDLTPEQNLAVQDIIQSGNLNNREKFIRCLDILS